MRAPLLMALAAASFLAPASLATIETYRFDVPSAPLAIFGREWFQDYITPARIGVVAGARMHLEFDTASPLGNFHDASDILLQMQLATTTVPFWNVQGIDLGWTGQGQFSANLSTDVFNGQPLIFDPDVPLRDQLIFWLGRIVSANDNQQFLGGQFANSYWEFDLDVVPAPGALGFLGLSGLVALRRRRMTA